MEAEIDYWIDDGTFITRGGVSIRKTIQVELKMSVSSVLQAAVLVLLLPQGEKSFHIFCHFVHLPSYIEV